MKKPIEPWEKQKGESTKTYTLFNEYLKLGSMRTLVKVREQVTRDDNFLNTPTLSSLTNLSSKWEWVKRAEAYDIYQIEFEREELEARAKRRLKVRLDQAEKEEDKFHDEMMRFMDMDDKTLSPSKKAYAISELSKAKKNATDSQRLDFGEPTNISKTEVKGEMDISGDPELLKDPDWIQAKRKAMDDYYYAKNRPGGSD